MSAAATQPRMALADANRIRVERARQRKGLRGRDFRRIIPALVHPSAEMASYRLRHLFAGNYAVIRGANHWRLEQAMEEASGLREIRAEMRLGDLTLRERRALIKALTTAKPIGGGA